MTVVRDVIVIGGGASGMMAAICAARQGRQVTILEKEEKPGRKLLATGNGKCNFTNKYQSTECYYTRDKAFVSSVLKQFGEAETLAFFEELGLYPTERNGGYYPHSGQAETVVRILCQELSRLKVKIKCREKVKMLKKLPEGVFQVETETYTYTGKRVILAAGGKASPVLGSDGSGYELAKAAGHRITPLYPGLTGLISKEVYFSELAGVRARAELILLENGNVTQKETGEVQLAAYGLSGIPVFQLCHKACEALAKGKKTEVLVNFLRELGEKEFRDYLDKLKERNPGLKKQELLSGIFDRKLARVLATWGEQGSRVLRVGIKDSCDFTKAQVTAGGVYLSEINEKTMESEKLPGLYITGELLDVDGICGGYNLQWAWSTGYLAGCACGINTSLKREEPKTVQK